MAPLDARATQENVLTIAATGLELPFRRVLDGMAALVEDDSSARRVASQETTLGCEDVIVGTQRLFKAQGWRITSESARTTTFVGRPRIPWRLVALTAVGMLALVVPGFLFCRFTILKRYGFSTIVISATAVRGGTKVVVEYPAAAEVLVQQLMKSLPLKQ